MEYELVKKHAGIQKTETVTTINNDFEIKDFYYSDITGFLFIAGNAISVFQNETYINPWCGSEQDTGERNSDLLNSRFNCPSSLFVHEPKNTVYVCEDNGKSIRKIDLKTNNVSSIIKGSAKQQLEKEFKKSANYNGKTGVVVDRREDVYWTSEVTNKIFRYRSPKVVRVMGTGARGFSNATQLQNSMINQPKALSYNQGHLYLLDSGNKCVRQVKDGSKVIFQGESKDMQDLACCRSSVYVLDETKVLNFTLGKTPVVVYENENIVSITTDKHSNLYVLKEV